MKKLILFAVFLLLFTSGQAFGLSITVYNANTQQTQIDSWISLNGGAETVVEDFEGIDPGWYGETSGLMPLPLSTGVGNFTFTNNTDPGIGGSSYGGTSDTSTTAIHVIEDSGKPWGRYNTTPGGDRWLDSADVTEILLTLTIDTNALYFYMMDPSDVGAKTQAASGVESVIWNHSDSDTINAGLFFVGIQSDTRIESITWSTNGHQNDGYGLDDFTTVSVPEPANMLLLGTGLICLAGMGRKKVFKR